MAAIEHELIPTASRSHLRNVIEERMLAQPEYWQSYYHGDEAQLAYLRGFSHSDRIRYYWNDDAIKQAVTTLLKNLSTTTIPTPRLHQYLEAEFHRIGVRTEPLDYVFDKIHQVLEAYRYGCQPH